MDRAGVIAVGREPMRRVRLLNVDVHDVTMDELVESFREGLLLTLHTDMLMKLQKDREFYELLPKFEVVTCDSQILFFAAKLLGLPLRERVSGSDFFPRFYMKHRDDPRVTVFICGGAPGVPEIAARNVNAKVGRTMVVGVDSPSLDFERRPAELERLLARINDSKASVLLVGLGGGRQEKFIVNYRHRLPYVRTFLPLGGTIDYEAGTLRRPRSWVTDAGLEWLYRVVRQPRQRWRRYLVHQPPVMVLLAQQWMGTYRNPFAEPERQAVHAPLSSRQDASRVRTVAPAREAGVPRFSVDEPAVRDRPLAPALSPASRATGSDPHAPA